MHCLHFAYWPVLGLVCHSTHMYVGGEHGPCNWAALVTMALSCIHVCLTLQYSTLPCEHHSPQAWHLALEGVCCDYLASWQALAWLGIWGCEVRKGSLILLAWEVHGAAVPTHLAGSQSGYRSLRTMRNCLRKVLKTVKTSSESAATGSPSFS